MKSLKKILTEETLPKLKIIVENIGDFNHPDKTYTPTEQVAQTARKALERLTAEGSGNIEKSTSQGSGTSKARELSEKKPQTLVQLKKIANFFETNKDVNSLEYNLHGGSVCKSWIQSILGSLHKSGLNTKKNLRVAGGAGTNKGMGSLDKTMMDPTKMRIHR